MREKRCLQKNTFRKLSSGFDVLLEIIINGVLKAADSAEGMKETATLLITKCPRNSDQQHRVLIGREAISKKHENSAEEGSLNKEEGL
ncbi:hypothetical protein Glove_714g10 [Diversispora epigaea]|uniref:Uncharacterized protein n=1 Tax=Diversispora epigaea TaxID=1348612 RepID=A0A397G5M5_9GLOM|nr:hypothetical protein Glove_714g10 [Diversispora epigaea]